MSVTRMLIAAPAFIAIAYTIYWAHGQQIKSHPILPVAFEHRDHQDVQCIQCHHNYVDDTGHDSCYSCHKHDPSVALEIEKMFHDFCRDCHIKEAQLGKVSGPFRECKACHNDSGRLASRGSLLKR